MPNIAAFVFLIPSTVSGSSDFSILAFVVTWLWAERMKYLMLLCIEILISCKYLQVLLTLPCNFLIMIHEIFYSDFLLYTIF